MDNAASGSANGTSWANAWTDLTTVVWGASGVTAGDTLYVSGGTTNKTYTNEWTVGASGTLASPITIRTGLDDGHNGTWILDGSKYGTNCLITAAISCFRSNVTFTGYVDGLTNFVIRNWFNATNKNVGRAIFAADPAHNLKIFHTTISNINTAIHVSSLTNTVIGWCDLRPIGDTAIAMVDSRVTLPDKYDSHLVFSNRITVVYNDATGGSDGVQALDGVSIFNNRFETIQDDSLTNRVSNHIDFFQSDGWWHKLYNNEVVNIGDSGFSPATFTAGKGLSDIRIYNNIFRITTQIDVIPQYIRMYNNAGLAGYTNVHILNNLFIDRTNATQAIYLGPEIGNEPGTNNVIANNIFVNVGMPTGAIWQLDKTDGIGQSEWTITNNIMYHPTPSDARVNYLETNYTVATWKATYDPSTGTNLPSFVSYTPYRDKNDYHLNHVDTAAIGVGFDYSSLFTTDFDGNPRSAPWDMGPFQSFNTAELIECQIGPRLMQVYVEAASDQITFHWPPADERIVFRIFRRVYTNPPAAWFNWTNIYAVTNSGVELAGTFTDTNVTSGVRYEYQITQLVTNWVCNSFTTNQWWDYQYISTGTEVPIVDTRGKLILLVESGVAASLTTELDRLEEDLIGDGYKIFRHDIASVNVLDAGWAAAVAATKALITTDYNTDTNSDWTIFIVGNVPIPYSGLQSPGSHTENFGAHVADWYYADIDGTWTDTTANDTTADYTNNWNIPGDGKFDQNFLPSPPEARIGRINLRNMPAFGKTEVQLLQQYLDRNHAWRHKEFTVRDRGLIIPEGRPREGHDFNAGFFGNAHSTDLGLWLDVATNAVNSYLFAGSTGAGSFTNDFELGTTDDFAAVAGLFVAFPSMHGSYYGNWDSVYHTNVVILAPLAAEGYALANYYREQANNYDFVSMGDPIGKELYTMALNHFLTESEFFNIHIRFHQFGQVVSGSTFITAERPAAYTSLLGDPTLRVRVVAPPSNVAVTASGSDNIVSWDEANDYDVQGYHVYRAPSSDLNDFTRLTSVLETDDSYTDTGAASGSWTYMVRTVKLEDENSRSYYNASQGILAEDQSSPPPPPTAGGSVFDGKASLRGNATLQ